MEINAWKQTLQRGQMAVREVPRSHFWSVFGWLGPIALCCGLACSSPHQAGAAQDIGAGTSGAAGSSGVAGTPVLASGQSGSSAGRGGTTNSTGGTPAGSAGVGGATGVSGSAAAGRGAAGAAGAAGVGGGSAGTSASAGAGGSAGTAAYDPCPTNGDACKILPIGDSITFGIQFAGSYRVELFRQAVTAQQHITFVGSQMNGPDMVAGMTFPKNHEGYSGWTIDQIAGLIPTPALQSMPAIILLMAGTNDIYGSDPANAPKRLGTLLDKITSMAPDALLVVAQLTPLPNFTSAVMTFNQALPALVSARVTAGKHIMLVDMSGTMISSDSVHPNEAGYTHMGQVWYTAIGPLLPH